MLAKKNRLTRSEFDEVFKQNQTTRSEHFLLLSPTDRNDAELSAKYAVVVSKKTLPRRVDRNRIRRLVYQVIRQLMESNSDIKSGAIILNKSSRDIIKKSSSNINLEITKLLSK